MKFDVGMIGGIALAVFCSTACPAAENSARTTREKPIVDYIREPMPPGFQVVDSELAGPVYADNNGKTLYTWPMTAVRGGRVGDQEGGVPSCDNTHYRETAGLESPDPAGLELPDVDTRPSCMEVWPPVFAPATAQPVGKWSIVQRKDGSKQWAYGGLALYTSVLDVAPGDINGDSPLGGGGINEGAIRHPVRPRANVPSQFRVALMALGQMLVTAERSSIYTSDRDSASRSSCFAECLLEWTPVLAPESAIPYGEWSVFVRSPGVKQWAFRTKPLYTRIADGPRSYEGSDQPGWHNVFTHRSPAPPEGFTVQNTRGGQVLASKDGKTIYVYNCNDDALDQLACNYPDAPQAYRLAVCGGGDPVKCLQNFPYVLAEKAAKSGSRAWSVMDINPLTGRRAVASDTNSLRVWAYRGRPVYHFVRDQKPGDIEGDAFGEVHGLRNGFKAFWLRDDFSGNGMAEGRVG